MDDPLTEARRLIFRADDILTGPEAEAMKRLLAVIIDVEWEKRSMAERAGARLTEALRESCRQHHARQMSTGRRQ